MSLDAQQWFSHCFLDGLHHPIISYCQNASRYKFLGLEFFRLFLGFPLFLVWFFFRLISGEAGFNSHLVYGQFVQDNLAFFPLLVLFVRVWLARRRLLLHPQSFCHLAPHVCDVKWINSHHCHTIFSANHSRLHFHLHISTSRPLSPSANQSAVPLRDDPTGHTPQFRAYLIFVVRKRLWATRFVCNHSTHMP